MVVINDCRGKEVLTIRRRGGDFETKFATKDGSFTAYWFEMKKPHAKTYKELEALMMKVKQRLEGQE